jgi:putative hemolysin
MRALLLLLMTAALCISFLFPEPVRAQGIPADDDTSQLGLMGMANPAAVYCRELGYEIEVIKTEVGDQCICILPNGERCDAWAFYRGEVWPEYGYCARQGYGTEVRIRDNGSYTTKCAVCLAEDGTELGTVSELMNFDDKLTVGTRRVSDKPTVRRSHPRPKSRELPTYFNWCDHGGCTSVKDQASCGSCWAFATVVPIECNILIKDSVEVDLSEQWLVSCNQDDWSCYGGFWAHDYHQWKTDPCGGAGAVMEEDFPYMAQNLPCNCPYPHPYEIWDWDFVGDDSSIPPIEDIKQALLDYGPLTIGIEAASFGGYTGGVYNDCPEVPRINHGVGLVGWDDNQGTEGVWIFKNSWGPNWGEEGYMRIEYGCRLSGYATCWVDYRCIERAVVNSAGTGDYPTIQAAIDASPPECGCVITLENGTYTGPGNRDLDLQGKSVTIRSLSFDPSLCIIDCGNLSRFATVDPDEGELLKLEAVRITSGLASGVPPDDCGGAIWCRGGMLRLSVCEILDCDASGNGGAIYADSSMVTVIYSEISGNSSGASGGGVYCTEASELSMSFSEVTDNTALSSGGAIAVACSAGIRMVECTLSGNSTEGGGDGGGAIFATCDVDLESCVLSGNRSAGAGGAISLSAGEGADPWVLNCTLADNYAATTGGGLHVTGPSVTRFDHSIVWGNGAAGPGSEVYMGTGSTVECACSDTDPMGIEGDGTLGWLWYNISANPGFCDPEGCEAAPTSAGDYHLKDVSPCADENAAVGLIGALEVGCVSSVFTVNPDGSGEFATLQAAVDGAAWYDVIELSEGVFEGPGNRDIDLGGKALTIRSLGDAGSTTIDCGGLGRAFHFHSGEGPETQIRDLTIAHGYADRGGAVLCSSSSPTIAGCVFHHNEAELAGGAICCLDGSSPDIDACTLSENRADEGAGIHSSASPVIVDNMIIAFSSSGEAASCEAGGSVSFSCSNLYGNAGGDWVNCLAGQGSTEGNFSADPEFCDRAGHDYHLDSGSSSVEAPGCGPVGALGIGCYQYRVWNVPGDAPNIQAGIDSAGIGDTVVVACGTYYEYGIAMKSGVVLRSEAGAADYVTIDAGQQGRVLTCIGADSTCMIQGLTLTGGLAAGLWPSNAGGGVYCQEASPRIVDCLITGNTAQHGGGMACKDSSPRIMRCTLSGNSAPTGAGIYNYHSSELRLENSIVAFNAGGEAVDCYYYATATISCSDLYGNEGGDWTDEIADQSGIDGNFSADPCFCQPFTGHLAALSPCVEDHSPETCGSIGALGVGCPYTEVTDLPVEIPIALYLGPAVPNPFNPVTEITYGIPRGGGSSEVAMDVYDALGRRVRTLVDAEVAPGRHRVIWDGTDQTGVPVASGVYFYRISWNGRSETKRMVLLK